MPSTEQTTKEDLTTRTLLELLVAYTLILITVWTSGRTQRVLFYASGGWILLNSLFPRQTRELIGFRLSGLQRSWWIVAAALAAGSVAVAVAVDVSTLHLPSRDRGRAGGLVQWSGRITYEAIFRQSVKRQWYLCTRLSNEGMERL